MSAPHDPHAPEQDEPDGAEIAEHVRRAPTGVAALRIVQSLSVAEIRALARWAEADE
jgi:hypothetical protein